MHITQKQGNNLLKQVDNYLSSQGVSSKDIEDKKTIVAKYLLPALSESKDIQSPLYQELIHEKSGFLAKIKAIIAKKIISLSRNVVEKSFLNQQKFNNNLVEIVSFLVKENQELQKKVEILEKSHEKKPTD